MVQLFPVTKAWSEPQLPDAPAVELPESPAANELSSLEEEIYHLDLGAAASLGFPVAEVAGNAEHKVLLLGTSRFKDVTGPNSHIFRFGVAIRSLIVISAVKIDFTLTLPVVAAKVQLNAAEASAQLLLQGYKGPLGTTLPAWGDFDVDSFAQYTQHVSQLQAQILNDAANIVPELLGTSAPSVAVNAATPAPASAIGVIYALQAIADGASLSHALDKFRVTELEARAVVRAMYADKVGQDDSARPNQATQEEARTALLGFHLGRGILHFDV